MSTQKTQSIQLPHPSIAVGILFFEKIDQTIECIASFLPAQIPIYVCNNGSSAASRQKLSDCIKDYPQVHLIDAPENLGVSGGRNLLIQSISEDWIFFVDNDITITTSDWLSKFTVHQKGHPEAEAFIPRLYNVFERTYSPRHEIHVDNDRVTFTHRTVNPTINLFPGGASIVRRSVFDRIGLYDADMFVNYEDYELCLRGVLKHQPVLAQVVDDITLCHDHRQVKTDQDRAYVAIRYNHDRTQSSADRIFKKYGLRITDDASGWTAIQQQNLLQGRKWFKKETILYLIPVWIKRIWNNRR